MFLENLVEKFIFNSHFSEVFWKGTFHYGEIPFNKHHFDLRLETVLKPEFGIKVVKTFEFPLQYSTPSKEEERSLHSISCDQNPFLQRTLGRIGSIHPFDFYHLDFPFISILRDGGFSIIHPYFKGRFKVLERSRRCLILSFEGIGNLKIKLLKRGNFYYKPLVEIRPIGILFFRKAKREGEEFAWYLVYPHGTMIAINYFLETTGEIPSSYKEAFEEIKKERKFFRKKAILKSKYYKGLIGRDAYLIEGKNLLGKIRVLPGEKIRDFSDFEKREPQHCVLKEEAIKWWGKTHPLFFHPVNVIEMYEKPLKVEYERGPQAIIRKWEVIS